MSHSRACVIGTADQVVHGPTTRHTLLIQDRAVSRSSEWREQIQVVDRATLQHLREHIAGGFDEERFGACIGFGNL